MVEFVEDVTDHIENKQTEESTNNKNCKRSTRKASVGFSPLEVDRLRSNVQVENSLIPYPGTNKPSKKTQNSERVDD